MGVSLARGYYVVTRSCDGLHLAFVLISILVSVAEPGVVSDQAGARRLGTAVGGDRVGKYASHPAGHLHQNQLCEFLQPDFPPPPTSTAVNTVALHNSSVCFQFAC